MRDFMGEDISIIGAGVIGGAIARCLVRSGSFRRIIATRRRAEKLKPLSDLGVEVTTDNLRAAREGEIIIICVKPKDVSGVLRELREAVEGKLVISTAATIPLSIYRSTAPGARYVRAMPNIAALVGESFTAYCCDEMITERDRDVVKRIFETMGPCEEVEEGYMDAVTGLSGSGPAYIATIIEAMMYAGLKVGLPRELSLSSSAQAVLGTAKLILEGGLTPSEIKEMVTTPGGTTIEGLYQLEDGKVRTALMRAVEAATEKCTTIRRNWVNEKT